MRTVAISIRSWASGSPRPAASRNARRRTLSPLLEPLEERWLLDGQLPYGDFGGSCRPTAGYTCTVYSAIGMGSALSAALVMLNLGNAPGPQTQGGDGQFPDAEPLEVLPAELQQLAPALPPLPLTPLPGLPADAPEVSAVPDDLLESIARTVVTPLV